MTVCPPTPHDGPSSPMACQTASDAVASSPDTASSPGTAAARSAGSPILPTRFGVLIPVGRNGRDVVRLHALVQELGRCPAHSSRR